MDILPVYILLLLGFPLVLWLLLRAPALALIASAALYLAAKVFGWNLPLYPGGHWIINPFHWQLLFVLGAWCALSTKDRLGKVLSSPVIVAVASLYLLVAFIIVRSWYWPQLGRFVPDWLEFIYPIDKTNLDVLRLTHFLALAIVTVAVIPRDWGALHSPLLRPVILCGQNSLAIFCLGIFLSFAGHFVITELSARLATQVLVSIGGIAIMSAVAVLMSWYYSTEKRSIGSRPPPPDGDIAGGGL